MPSERDGSTSTQASSSACATSTAGSSGSQHTPCSRTSAAAISERLPFPTIRSEASGSLGAARRHAAARPSTFLYASSTPTKSATGSWPSGRAGATNGSRSMYAGKSAVASTPSSRTRRVVKGETVRTASERRSATAARASPMRASARRKPEPYRRVDVRQSPWTSTTIRAGTRARRRARSAAAAS